MSTWTNEKPTVPGWYWFRRHELGANMGYVKQYDIDKDTLIDDAEWAGPIAEPQD